MHAMLLFTVKLAAVDPIQMSTCPQINQRLSSSYTILSKMLVNIKLISTTFLLKTGRKANEPLSSANNKILLYNIRILG